VDYGSGKLEDLDLFLPPDPQGAPIHTYIHGGFWRSRYKTDFSYIAEPLVDAGAIVAIVNYALCPNVDLDEIVRQMRAATGWLWRNAARFGGDPERIHIGGHSAGAHLGAMVLTTDWQAFSLEVPSDVIKSATLISGVYEIEPVLHTSVQEEVRLTREMAIQNSPMFLSPTSKASIAVTVGGAESEEFRRQSEEFTRRWRQYGLNVTHYELPRSDHFSVLTETANDANPLTETRLRLMGLI